MKSVVVKDLNKSFKNFKAVSDLSFEVKKGRVVGLLGPNGAGKTTTIRMIVGLSKITSGEILLNNKRVIFGDESSNQSIGYLPEQSFFYAWMTGQEYMSFVADIFGLSVDTKKERVNNLLQLVGLSEFKNKKIQTYSNGMKQRLGIAQALINDPEILIFDEPVSALDPVGRKEVLRIIENLKAEKTIFFSTHVLSDVDRICDDIILINKGKLVVSSPLSELKEQHAAPILVVEFSADPAALLDKIKSETWAKKVEKNGNQLKIWLEDEQDMSSNLPLIFFSHEKLGVLSYGLVLPETEDLFMELLGEE